MSSGSPSVLSNGNPFPLDMRKRQRPWKGVGFKKFPRRRVAQGATLSPYTPPTENLAGMMFPSHGQVTSQAAKNGVQNGEWRPNSVQIASRIAPIILLPYLASCGLTPDCQTASQMSEPKPKSA